MIKIEEKDMVNGLSLKKMISVALLLVLFSCSITRNIENSEPQLSGLLRNFISASNPNFKITTKYKIDRIDKIEINQPNDFKITSLKTTKKGSIIEVLKTSDKIIQGLTLYFYDDSNDFKKIQINFYSELINIFELNKDDEIVFDRSQDVVPPLFFMRTSLQDGIFKVCVEDEIIHEFSMLHDLYFLSFRPIAGDFTISEVDCENVLFRYVVLP